MEMGRDKCDRDTGRKKRRKKRERKGGRRKERKVREGETERDRYRRRETDHKILYTGLRANHYENS